ncbi:hypothetical protein EV421DRAFT_1905260 [Armillaria borealis]|uniref:Uncharacterized protein n=1 Tax=Armillaria borealis TaxID=47425 RepID=A0AA39JEE1_9AGAR|nr:hypothetical protein EV421DRAFT_1905260 [Armillaria borealis]
MSLGVCRIPIWSDLSLPYIDFGYDHYDLDAFRREFRLFFATFMAAPLENISQSTSRVFYDPDLSFQPTPDSASSTSSFILNPLPADALKIRKKVSSMTKTRRRRSSLNPSASFSVSSSVASGSSVGTSSIFSFQGLSTPRTPSNLVPLSYEYDTRSYISSSGSGPSSSLLFDASPLPIPHSSDFSRRLQLVEPPSPLSPVLPDILNTFDVETADICAPDYEYS